LFDERESDFTPFYFYWYFNSFFFDLNRAFSEFRHSLQVFFSPFKLTFSSNLSTLNTETIWKSESMLAFILEFPSAYFLPNGAALPCFCECRRRNKRQRGAEHARDPE